MAPTTRKMKMKGMGCNFRSKTAPTPQVSSSVRQHLAFQNQPLKPPMLQTQSLTPATTSTTKKRHSVSCRTHAVAAAAATGETVCMVEIVRAKDSAS
jgi:hypothetical protein